MVSIDNHDLQTFLKKIFFQIFASLLRCENQVLADKFFLRDDNRNSIK